MSQESAEGPPEVLPEAGEPFLVPFDLTGRVLFRVHPEGEQMYRLHYGRDIPPPNEHGYHMASLQEVMNVFGRRIYAANPSPPIDGTIYLVMEGLDEDQRG
jgi:hypothetical protein